MRALLAAAVVSIAAPAAAQPHQLCAGADFEPAAVAVRDSGIDAPRSACMRSGAEVRARTLAQIDTNEFFGSLAGSLFLTGRWLILGGVEVEAGARLVDYRFAQNAVLSDDEISVGPVIAGIAQARPLRRFGRAAMWSPRLRVAIPGSNTGLDATPFSASPSATLTIVWSEATRTHSRAALLLWLARGASGLDSRAAASASTDVVWRPQSYLGFSAGLEVQAGWHDSLDHLLARGRVRFGGATGFDLSAGARVIGEERTDAVVSLGLSRSM